MKTNNPVLPNFLKVLTIALFTFGSASVFAGEYDKKEKIVELKEMSSDSQVIVDEVEAETLTDADAQAAEDKLTREIDAAAREMTDEDDAGIADE